MVWPARWALRAFHVRGEAERSEENRCPLPANAPPRLSFGVASEDLTGLAGRNAGWPTVPSGARLGQFRTRLSAQARADSQECARLAGRQQAPSRSPAAIQWMAGYTD